MRLFLALIIPFFITFCSIPLLRIIAFKLNILDLPGGRKVHDTPTPLLGGVAIYFGLLGGLLLSGHFAFYIPLISSALLILVVGLIDDIRGLSARIRLVFQLIASLVIISNGWMITLFHGDLGYLFNVIITLIWIIGITNAFNYLDGLDGLAAGSAVINLFFFGLILFSTSQSELGIFSLILVFVCLGFLPYNFKKFRKMFLGDAGSTVLGFSLASIALGGYWAEDSFVKITIPILILGVPIFDMIFTTIMRTKEGKIKSIPEWLKYAGKDHFHHYLVDLGLGGIGSVVFIYFVSCALGISAIMINHGKPVEALMTLAQSGIIFGMIAVLIVAGKRHQNKGHKEEIL